MNKLLRYCGIPIMIVTSLTWLPSLASYAENAVTIKRDPFQGPKHATVMMQQVAGHPLQMKHAAVEGKVEEAVQPKLRAILYDPKKPMVNMGGQIIEVGESIQGYTLLKVAEREAIFSRGGQPVRLSIDGAATP